jgi:hypothetical protein
MPCSSIGVGERHEFNGRDRGEAWKHEISGGPLIFGANKREREQARDIARRSRARRSGLYDAASVSQPVRKNGRRCDLPAGQGERDSLGESGCALAIAGNQQVIGWTLLCLHPNGAADDLRTKIVGEGRVL